MWLQLFRVKQWVKNGFIVLPLIFSGQFVNPSLWLVSFKAILGFSFIASMVYIVNDLIDRQTDILHPAKSKRPIASGKISPRLAIVCAFLSFILGCFFLRTLGPLVWMTVVSYVFLQIIYNIFTRKWVILDVLTVALGFLVRVWVGALAIGVLPSMWLQLCVFALALFLGFTKRRYELVVLDTSASRHRFALSEYTVHFLDQMIMICSTLSIVFYGLYTISAEVTQRLGHSGLLYSVGFVIYGMFRYLYLVHVKKLGDDPGDILLRDGPLLLNIAVWLIFIAVLILQVKG